MGIQLSILRRLVFSPSLRLLLATLLGVAALIFNSVPCKADKAAAQEALMPKVILNGGTQEDANGAIAVAEKFLRLWEQNKYEQACVLVAEPVRKQFEQHMKKRPIELQTVRDIRLFSHKDRLFARVHAWVAPWPSRKDLTKQGIGIDMVFQDGKWWITVR